MLSLASIMTGCVSISAFASLVCLSVDITSSAITTGIKKYKSKHDKLVLLGKDKLNTIEVPIFKALIDSYISHDEFVSINNVLRECYEMKEEIKS